MVPREVSICHLGARDKTLIANLELSAEEYKSGTQRPVHTSTAATAAMSTQEKMDTKADAASTGAPAEPTPPVAEVSPEEQCVSFFFIHVSFGLSPTNPKTLTLK